MQLRASIDCDGVITDPLPGWFKAYSKADHPHENLHLLMTPRNYMGPEVVCAPCFQAVIRDEEAVLDCTPYPGVNQELHLCSLHVHLTLLTHRRPEVELATHQWLERERLRWFFAEVAVMQGSKAEFCLERHMHYHVDDSPNVAADFADLPRRHPKVDPNLFPRLIVVDKPYNQDVPCYMRVPYLAGRGGALEFLVKEGIAYNDLHA